VSPPCVSSPNNPLPSAPPTSKTLEVDGAHNPFSPFDVDSNFRNGRIFFNVKSNALVKTVKICDPRGATVRVLVNQDRGPGGLNLTGAGSGTILWDGRDDDGNLLPMGLYIVYLEGTDPATGERARGKALIALGR